MSLLAVSLLALAGAVSIDLAPDQPLPYVYVDDPLIIEVQSDQDAVADVEVWLKASHGEAPIERSFPQTRLHAEGARWIAIEDLPRERGYYTAEVRVTVDGAETTQRSQFARIDRPLREGLSDVFTLPFYGVDYEEGAHSLLALRAAGLQVLRLSVAAPNLAELLAEAQRLGFKLIIYVDSAQVDQPADMVRALAEQGCPNIVRWELDVHGDVATLGSVAEALKQTPCNAPVAMVAPDVESFQHLLAAGAATYARETVVRDGDTAIAAAEAIRRSAEAAGYESWTVHLLKAPAPEEENDAEVVKDFFIGRAAGVKDFGLDASWIYDGQLRPTLVYLSGLRRRLFGEHYAGSLDLGAGVTAPLLRRGGAWLLALWSEGGARQVRVPVKDARGLMLADALNNEIDLPELSNGELALEVGERPLYLSGSGGNILAMAAAQQVQEIAQQFAATPAFQERLPQVVGLVQELARDSARVGAAGLLAEEQDAQRSRFLTLVRLIPELERRWHAGELPRTVAAPVISAISRLAQAYAPVLEEQGVTFVEPLQETLADAETAQSLYLTSSTSEAAARRERGDWILNEVRRLLDLAELQAKAGRKTEANALATLAEWRAASLELAADAAPLGEGVTQLALAEAAPTPEAAPADAGEVESSTTPEEAETPEEAAPEPEETKAPEEASVAETPEAQEGAPRVHVVKPGDNLTEIAQDYGLTLEALMQANNLGRRSTLTVGQRLTIPGGEAPAETPEAPGQPEVEVEVEAPAPEQQETVHVVQRGENPSVIADKYGVSLDDLLEWNDLTRRSRLSVGQRLAVRGAAGNGDGQQDTREQIEHTVRRGENPSLIAQKYNVSLDDLLEWNNLTRRSRLDVGQVLVIRPGD